MRPIIEAEELWKTYVGAKRNIVALKGTSLSLPRGEFFTLLGPSGCGKTTVLRCLAGLEVPDAGTISISGQVVYSSAGGRVIPVHKRDIAMVFQSYAIWPHMTVAENVGFPLMVRRVPPVKRRKRVEETLELVGLKGFGERPATDLSGGQQQRVAVARAIIKGAKVLLLDEPLSNLDAMLRGQMRQELRDLQERIGTTTIYVTHDQEEALSLSDRIALMREGQVVEVGDPISLYMRPHRPFTAEFIGQADLWPCTFEGKEGGCAYVEMFLGVLAVSVFPEGPFQNASVYIRPEHIVVQRLDSQMDAPSRPNEFKGRVLRVSFTGKMFEYYVIVHDNVMRVEAMAVEPLAEGDEVAIWLPPERCVVVVEEAGASTSMSAEEGHRR